RVAVRALVRHRLADGRGAAAAADPGRTARRLSRRSQGGRCWAGRAGAALPRTRAAGAPGHRTAAPAGPDRRPALPARGLAGATPAPHSSTVAGAAGPPRPN